MSARVYKKGLWGKDVFSKKKEASAGLDRIVVQAGENSRQMGLQLERASAISRPNISEIYQHVDLLHCSPHAALRREIRVRLYVYQCMAHRTSNRPNRVLLAYCILAY